MVHSVEDNWSTPIRKKKSKKKKSAAGFKSAKSQVAVFY